MIEDVGSRNGVFIGNQKVQAAEAPSGTQIRLGQTVMLVAEPSPNPTSQPGRGSRVR